MDVFCQPVDDIRTNIGREVCDDSMVSSISVTWPDGFVPTIHPDHFTESGQRGELSHYMYVGRYVGM